MMFQRATIEPQVEGKGRSFSALCLASVEADSLWDGGQTNLDEKRPVWAMFAGSEQELRPFMANLRTGRRIEFPLITYGRNKRMSFLKSAKHAISWQREVEGTAATVYLPDLFQMDPGMVDPAGAAFVVLPTDAWSKSQVIDLAPLVQHVKPLVPLGYDREPVLTDDAIAEMIPLAFLFAAYLDRRTRCPLLADGRFYLQLMLACLAEGLASMPSTTTSSYSSQWGIQHRFGFSTSGTEELGISQGIAFKAEHPAIDKILAEQVALFFQATGNR